MKERKKPEVYFQPIESEEEVIEEVPNLKVREEQEDQEASKEKRSSLNVEVEVIEEEEEEVGQPHFANIKVVGVGGAGCNAIHRMKTSGVEGVTYIAINTDAQALASKKADKKIHIGKKTTRGLGTGNRAELAEEAAMESQDEIRKALEGADMVFITAGMGGGTGTGASPVIAKIARDELGILTVAIVTKPFSFEGTFRARVAEAGISKLKEHVDALIVVENDKLLTLGDDITFSEAFRRADEVLKMGIQGITDIITKEGFINVDFADVRTILENAGSAWLGIGEASGENKAREAAKMAITNPLVEHSIEGAKKILVSISGSPNLKLSEVYEAMSVIEEMVDEEPTIIFGAVLDEALEDTVRIIVIATSFSRLSGIEFPRKGAEILSNFEEVGIDMSSVYSEDLPQTFSRARRYQL